jgi:hypothetical protein
MGLGVLLDDVQKLCDHRGQFRYDHCRYQRSRESHFGDNKGGTQQRGRMMNPLPYISFWSPEMLDGFWQYLKAYLWLGAPLIMIVMALTLVRMLINTIIDAIFGKPDEDREDDEEEVYYY